MSNIIAFPASEFRFEGQPQAVTSKPAASRYSLSLSETAFALENLVETDGERPDGRASRKDRRAWIAACLSDLDMIGPFAFAKELRTAFAALDRGEVLPMFRPSRG
jgi:hypothetical protein